MFRSPHRRRETGRGTECPFDLLVCCAERCPAPEESADRRTAARAQGRTGLPNFSHPTRSAISSSSQGGRGGPRRGDGAVRAPPVHVLPPAVPVTRATGAPSSLCARGQPQKAADDWVGGVSSTRLTPRAPYGLPPPYPLPCASAAVEPSVPRAEARVLTCRCPRSPGRKAAPRPVGFGLGLQQERERHFHARECMLVRSV